jgi:phage gp36-like protein
MMPLVSVEQFLERVRPSEPYIPLNEAGEPDGARLELALSGATGVIVAHLPWLLDKETGEVARPVTPQFADALDAVCIDIAVYRMSDSVTGSRNTRYKYRESVTLLKKINKEYQGGLEGPGWQTSEAVTPNEAEGITDGRFFKKGRMF